MKRVILLVLISTFAFSIVPLYRVDDTALVLENPREFLGFEFDLSAVVLQNLLTIQDLIDIMNGATIVIDKERLDLITDNVLVDPMVDSIATLGFGTKNFKLGAFAKIESAVKLTLPKDLARLLLGDMDFEENVDEEFNMFKGGLLAKVGGVFAMRFGSFGFGLRGGLFLPVAWFDPESKVKFVYESDPDRGYIHTELSGGSEFYTVLSSFNSIDPEDLLDSAGYFFDLGVSYSYGPIIVGASVDNVSIKSAVLNYYGHVEATFEATLQNLEFESQGPDYSLSEVLEASTPLEVSAPMGFKVFGLYDMKWISFGGHFEYVPSLENWKAGAYASVYDVLWFDLSMLSSGYWEKLVGVNLDLRLLRFSATLGVLDTSIVNFDPSKMIGISLHAGVGLGF